MDNSGAPVPGQALVSDQARAGLDPSGFDPSRITEALSPLDVDVLEPLIRKSADDFYGYVVDAVRDYLLENLDFNLKSHVSMLERENQRMRNELWEADILLSGRWNTSETRLAEIERLKRRDTDRSGEADETAQQAQPEGREPGSEGHRP